LPLGGGHLDDVRPRVDVEPLAVDLVVALFVTAGFMLLMQELLRERIERLVVTDALTGTLNRHGLVPPLTRELTNAERHDRPLSVVMFDLDHFKRVNDVHGHAMGDTVLAGFAARVTALMRGGDMIGRWGGEEFLLVLPDTTAGDAKVVAERIREGIAKEPVAQGAPLVTVSGGIASFLEVRDRTRAMLEMLEIADRRLYIAKKQRNLVVSSGGEPLHEARAAGTDGDSPQLDHRHS
jgi:diguanylate cyclase (GGDEF)-like protein